MDQVNLVAREATPVKEELTQEDLLVNEAIEELITENLNAEANPANGDLCMEENRAEP